ncbi:hypothetical protein [Streptomyces klenkii]|uniref:hypothetical protein n=1 Tax=Streptomyces klenkii TaxID=1420899 RepID=UPI00343FF600
MNLISRTLAAVVLAGAALALAGPAHADDHSPTEGVRFVNLDALSFLPGVVDETWIVVFGSRTEHFGTNK